MKRQEMYKSGFNKVFFICSILMYMMAYTSVYATYIGGQKEGINYIEKHGRYVALRDTYVQVFVPDSWNIVDNDGYSLLLEKENAYWRITREGIKGTFQIGPSCENTEPIVKLSRAYRQRHSKYDINGKYDFKGTCKVFSQHQFGMILYGSIQPLEDKKDKPFSAFATYITLNDDNEEIISEMVYSISSTKNNAKVFKEAEKEAIATVANVILRSKNN